MTLFELVKQTIHVRDAAEHYGLQVNRSGMCRCPFHDDRHPSMKLNEKYFYCFGCGGHRRCDRPCGKALWFEQLRGGTKAGTDFGIDPDKPPAAIALPKPKRPLLTAYRQEEMRCLRVLCDYLHLLERWKVQYAPKTRKMLWMTGCGSLSDAGVCGVSGGFAHCCRTGTAGKNRRNAGQR